MAFAQCTLSVLQISRLCLYAILYIQQKQRTCIFKMYFFLLYSEEIFNEPILKTAWYYIIAAFIHVTALHLLPSFKLCVESNENVMYNQTQVHLHSVFVTHLFKKAVQHYIIGSYRMF